MTAGIVYGHRATLCSFLPSNRVTLPQYRWRSFHCRAARGARENYITGAMA